MKKTIRLTESQLKTVIKNVIKEQENQLQVNAVTQAVNNATGENITPEQSKYYACEQNIDNADLSHIPQNQQQQARSIIQQIKEKVKTAPLQELVKNLRLVRQKMREKRATNEQLETTMVTVLGITMSEPLFVLLCAVLFIVFMWGVMSYIFKKSGGYEAYSCASYGFQRHPSYAKTSKQINRGRR